MNEEIPPRKRTSRRKRSSATVASLHPFAGLPPTAQVHFKLCFYAATLNLLEQVSQSFDSREEALKRFPFLISYHNELADLGLSGIPYESATAWWNDSVIAWEEGVTTHLPLRALRLAAGLDQSSLNLFLTVGLLEEDVRFGLLYETMQGTRDQHFPTIALLQGWWKETLGDAVRPNIRRLLDMGLLEVSNPDAPFIEWALKVPALVWDAVRGETPVTLLPGMVYQPPEELVELKDLIAPEALRANLETIPRLFASGKVQTLIVRGPQHNGRRTTLGALARALGRGLIGVPEFHLPQDERWSISGLLATLLNAVPVAVLDLAPSETANIPRPAGFTGPIGIVLGKQGGVSGSAVDQALTITLEMPEMASRQQHWLQGADSFPIKDLESITERFRMTSGNIRRTARIAQSYAALNGHEAITQADVQVASRALNHQMLDTLAVRLEVSGDWRHLAAGPETMHELLNLEARCRNRERLRSAVGDAFGSQLNYGVRALFGGPSGTGKTLAARLLASILGMDLYRLDLSSIVNKYIGETEKNLNQVFARAEELDVILLLDEGDALLTQRTSVQTSNDRYANLETNFLLQRLETFEGILIVTSNASDRIDGAFQRRMDVVVNFHQPDPAERYGIWYLHLPVDHAVDAQFLREVAGRCSLSGGQIRNAALHASLLAVQNGGVITSAYLEEAVQREYRKMGAVCPLRPMTTETPG